MKSYHGHRTEEGCVVEVQPYLVKRDEPPVGYPLPHLVRHSPTGFEWGYAGSGPSDLARSILADYLGFDVSARVYQRFKFLVVQRFTDGWILHASQIENYLSTIREELGGVTCLRCCDVGYLDKDYCACAKGDEFRRLCGDEVPAPDNAT